MLLLEVNVTAPLHVKVTEVYFTEIHSLFYVGGGIGMRMSTKGFDSRQVIARAQHLLPRVCLSVSILSFSTP